MIYKELLLFEKKVNESIEEFNRNKYKSGLRVSPRNIASIPTALAINTVSSIISGTSHTISHKKEIDDLRNLIQSKKESALNQIQNSSVLTSSVFDSVLNILNALFDCIEDYLGYEVYRNFLNEYCNISNSEDDKKSIQICTSKFKKDALARRKYMNSVILRNITQLELNCKYSVIGNIIYSFLKKE